MTATASSKKPPLWRLCCSECGHSMYFWNSSSGMATCQCSNHHCPQRHVEFSIEAASYEAPSGSPPESEYA